MPTIPQNVTETQRPTLCGVFMNMTCHRNAVSKYGTVVRLTAWQFGHSVAARLAHQAEIGD
ncbi:hypothetical protein D3C81_1884940 [compost metagenome]